MPNSLAHIGIQGFATRGLIRDADPKWIFLASILPDVPWILQRIVGPAFSGDALYDLRFYFIVQASLFGSLLLAGALASVSSRPWRVLAILGLGSLMHLLLDASQAKWASGVYLLAPVSWQNLRLGWYWPEGFITYGLTGLGLVFIGYVLWRLRLPPSDLRRPKGRAALVGAVCLAAYFTAPLALLSGPAGADSHSLQTLRDREQRAGRYVEFDRARLDYEGGQAMLRISNRERLRLLGPDLPPAAVVSVRGTFVDPATVKVIEIQTHWGGLRDLWSYIGLALTAGYWLAAILQAVRATPARRH